MFNQINTNQIILNPTFENIQLALQIEDKIEMWLVLQNEVEMRWIRLLLTYSCVR